MNVLYGIFTLRVGDAKDHKVLSLREVKEKRKTGTVHGTLSTKPSSVLSTDVPSPSRRGWFSGVAVLVV